MKDFNVKKPFSSRVVVITIKKNTRSSIEQIDLKIEDDGIGLEKNKITSGFGLLGMKERVEMHNGVFNFFSKPGNGLKIHIIVPVSN